VALPIVRKPTSRIDRRRFTNDREWACGGPVAAKRWNQKA
jgi:hypothetical protein